MRSVASARLAFGAVMLATVVLATAVLAQEPGAPAEDTEPLHTWEFTTAGAERLRDSIRGAGWILKAPLPPAMVFRSRDDRVVIASSIRTAGLPQQRISIEAWVMIDAPQTWGGIFSALQDNGGFEQGVLLGFRGNRFCFALASQGSDDGDGKLTYLTGRSAFTPGRFHHVVGTYDGARMRLYVDGEQEAESTEQKGPILYPRRAVVELGAYHDDDEDFPLAGLIGRVRVYGTALPGDAVQREFKTSGQRFAMPTPSEVSAYHFAASRDGLAPTAGGLAAAVAPTGTSDFALDRGPPAHLQLGGKTSFSVRGATLQKTSCSIEATVWPGSNRRRQSIVAAGGIALDILDGQLRFGIGDTYATVGSGFSPYRWHHVAATWDGSLLRLYLDGVHRSFARTRENEVDAGSELQLARGLQGRLHEVGVTNRVLTDAEIEERFAAKQKLFPTPLTLELGPIGQFTDSGAAQIRWRSTRAARSTWVELVDTDGALQRVAVREEQGLSIADISRMRPGLAYDYRIVIEGKDGSQHATDTFRLDTDFAFPSPDLLAPDPTPGALAELVAKIPTQKGYAVVIGGHHDLAVRIAAQTEMQVVIVEHDREVIAGLRDRLAKDGLYGVQVSVLYSDYAALRIGSDLANVVFVATDAEVEQSELARITRPLGGVVLDLAGQILLAKGKTSNTGEWTHQYGSAANTAASGDTLVGGPLELQWFGRPGPRPMMDRGARSPAPLATNGRLFIHGDRRLLALDAYNGTILWALEIPALRRTNVPRDCSNITADGDDLFAAVIDRLWRLEGQTGRLAQTYEIPADLRSEEDPAWGFIHVTDRLVLGTATTVRATYRGAEGEWYDKPGADAEHVLGTALFALDRKDGKPEWFYRGGRIVHPTITIDEDVIYLIEDRKPSPESIEKNRLVSQTGTDQYLVALEIATGRRVWERKHDFRKFQQAFYLSASQGVLVAVGTSGAYHVHAFDASTGVPMWQHSHAWKRDHHGGGLQHPVILGDVIYVEFKGIDLRLGKVVRDDLPDRRGCGTMSGSGRSLFFRHYDHTMWDLDTDVRTTLPGLRSGCWLSLIPAGGLLLAPESSSGCSCANPIQTSVAYRPKTVPTTRQPK